MLVQNDENVSVLKKRVIGQFFTGYYNETLFIWVTLVYNFKQVSYIQHHNLTSIYTTKSLVSICHHTIDPVYLFCLPPPYFTSENHWCFLYLCVFALVCSFSFFIFHILPSEIMQPLFFSDMSLPIVPLKSNHVVANGFLAVFQCVYVSLCVYLCMCVYTIPLSIHPSVGTYVISVSWLL